MIQAGTTHMGVATDHVIESFRNDLWPGYKTGAGIDPALSSQFPILEEAVAALGMVVWPMVEYEADDALAAAARAGVARSARRARDHLHARQGSCAIGSRNARRPDGSAGEDDSRRSRRDREVRRPAGLDPGLPCAGWRHVGRVSGSGRAGARSPPPRFSRSSGTSKRSRPTGASGK